MLIIRLKPIGKKHQISYRVGVSERRSKLNGRVIEDLGFYNPHTKACNFNIERINYWREKGAQLSDTVYNLLVKEGLIDGPKRKVKLNPPKKKEGEDQPVAEEKKEEASAEEPKEKPKEESAPEKNPEEKKEEASMSEPEAPKIEEAAESPIKEEVKEEKEKVEEKKEDSTETE